MLEILNKIATAEEIRKLTDDRIEIFKKLKSAYSSLLDVKELSDLEVYKEEQLIKLLTSRLAEEKGKYYCCQALIDNLGSIQNKFDKNSVEAKIIEIFKKCLTNVGPQEFYHPALPSTVKDPVKDEQAPVESEQAPVKYEQVISDHVAFISNVDGIEFLSWNVNEPNEHGGHTETGSYPEDPKQKAARFKRIVDALESFVKNNNPDFISLQEILGLVENEKDEKNDNDSLYSLIIKRLGNEYESIIYTNQNTKTADYKGQVTLYKKEKFEPCVGSEINYQIDNDLKGLASKFKFKDENISKKIHIANVHPSFKEIPTEHEINIKTWLKENTDSDTLAVVLGDFNCTIAPLNNEKPKNITSSTTPPSKTGKKGQGAYAIDGIFYATKDEKKISFKQGEAKQLNPLTGETFENKDLPVIKLKPLHKFQKEQISSQRLAICIDEDINNKKILNNASMSIVEYEANLRKKSKVKSLIVRKTISLNNIPGIGFSSQSEDFNNTFYYLAKDNRKIECHESDFSYFSATLKNMSELTRLLELTPRFQPLYRNIVNLRTNNLITQVCADSFIQLFQAMAHLKESKNTKTNFAVIDFFTKETTKILKNNKPLTEQDIEKLGERLDTALYGKEPLSKTVKFIIGGIIGGLLGLVLGAVTFAALTAWSGGFGAVPGALLGAAKGFSLGSALAVGGTTLASITGGSLGLFSAANNQDEYKTRKLKIDEVSKKVVEKSKDIKESLKPAV